jgi:ankyrin repeat protein
MARDDVDANQLDMAGNTPLHLAAREGRLSTISVLLHHGAKVDIKVQLIL